MAAYAANMPQHIASQFVPTTLEWLQLYLSRLVGLPMDETVEIFQGDCLLPEDDEEKKKSQELRSSLYDQQQTRQLNIYGVCWQPRPISVPNADSLSRPNWHYSITKYRGTTASEIAVRGEDNLFNVKELLKQSGLGCDVRKTSLVHSISSFVGKRRKKRQTCSLEDKDTYICSGVRPISNPTVTAGNSYCADGGQCSPNRAGELVHIHTSDKASEPFFFFLLKTMQSVLHVLRVKTFRS
jgi:hypothetical protein